MSKISKKIISFFLCFAVVFSFAAFTPADIFAEGNEEVTSDIKVSLTETSIEASSVINQQGYAQIYYTDLYEDEWGNKYDETFYALVDPQGECIIPGQAVTNFPRYNTFNNTFFVTENIICDIHKAYYDLEGNKIFSIVDLAVLFGDMEEGDEVSSSVDQVLTPFHDGRALVRYSFGTKNGKDIQSLYYVINSSGQILASSDTKQGIYYAGGNGIMMGRTSDGVSYYGPVYTDEKLIDLEGRGYALEAGAFYEGYAWVRDNTTRKVGFIDLSGNEVIPCEYTECGWFADGLTYALKDGKWGYINSKNETVIPFEYDKAYGSGDGLAVVGKSFDDGEGNTVYKYAYVDYSNKLVTDYIFDDLACFEKGTGYGIINGKLILVKKENTSGIEVEMGSQSNADHPVEYTINDRRVTVVSDQPCRVGYFDEESGSYVPINATVNILDGGYNFMVPEGINKVVVVVKGDTNGDGRLSNADSTKLKAAIKGMAELDGVKSFASDINNDNKLSNADSTKLKAVVKGMSHVEWEMIH